jgi:hypothetical protein
VERKKQTKSISLATLIAAFAIAVLLPCVALSQVTVQLEGLLGDVKVLEQRPHELVVSITDRFGKRLPSVAPSQLIIRDSAGNVAVIRSVQRKPLRSLQPMSISFVLDNSGSMFSNYDSLTKYLDQLIANLPGSFTGAAYAFDVVDRFPSHEPTRRKAVWIANSGITSDKDSLSRFWHFYDSIRADFTPLNDQMAAALWSIQMRRDRGDTNALDVLIVVSDGKDNASRTSKQTINDLLKATGVRLYSISFRVWESDRLAFETKGLNVHAGKLEELQSSIMRLREELGFAHHIRYYFPATQSTCYAKQRPKQIEDWKFRRD